MRSAAALAPALRAGLQRRRGPVLYCTMAADEPYARSGTLVCLGLPARAQFGVDWCVYTVGEAFMGMKLIPPGVHLALFAPADDAAAITTGFFFAVRPGEVVVCRWDASTEDVVPVADGSERASVDSAVRRLELDARLGPYDTAHAGTWAELSDLIDADVLERATIPLGTRIVPGAVDDETGAVRAPEPGAVVAHHAGAPRTPVFVRVRTARPARVGARASPAEVTRFQFDRSERLRELLRTEFGSPARAPADTAPDAAAEADGALRAAHARLLGELQLSFVLCLQLHSLSALEQWKALVALLCACDEALDEPRERALFSRFVRVLGAQLRHLPPDLFTDALSARNFLGPSLAGLHELLEARAGLPAGLRGAAARLWETVRERFGVDVGAGRDDIDPDDAPVVVDAAEAGLKAPADGAADGEPGTPTGQAAAAAASASRLSESDAAADGVADAANRLAFDAMRSALLSTQGGDAASPSAR